MGCGATTVKQDHHTPILTVGKPGLIMFGSTGKGPTIINFMPEKIQSIKSTFRLPKYAYTFTNGKGMCYMTGGVEELLSTSIQLRNFQDQEYEGNISKKFYKILLGQIFVKPQSSFQEMPQMINSRYAHCAVECGDGIYVMGGRQYGDDQTGILAACQKFSFTENKWKSIPNLQYPRAGASAVIYGEQIYIFGGYIGRNQRSRAIQSYSQGDSAWRKLPYRLFEGIQGFLTIANPLNPSSIFILGGKTNSGKSHQIIEINFDKWTANSMQPMHEIRCFHKGFLQDETIHIIGGSSDLIQSYNLKTNTSTIDKQLNFFEHCNSKELAAMSPIVQQINLTAKKRVYESPHYKNKVFIFGYAKQPFTKIIDLDNFVVISEGQSLNHNFYQFSTVAKVNLETCFVLGGINSDLTEVTDSAYSFNLLTQEIKYIQPMKSAKYGFSAAVKGSYLYIVGGRKLGGDAVAILSTCQRYSFETYKWQYIAPLNYKRHSALLLSLGNYLIAIGGYKGSGIKSKDIEIYIQSEDKWVVCQNKFELAVQAMTHIIYMDSIYLFGGRTDKDDIQKVFKLNINIDESKRTQKCLKVVLEPVGNLSVSGTNLKVYLQKSKGLAYIFGNVKYGIDVYDLKQHKIVQTEKLTVFQSLRDELFQSYALIF